jgi:hypothetical protein
MAVPQPGDFCCKPMAGAGGAGISIGQWLDGGGLEFYDHAEVYVGGSDNKGPFGYTVSAYPNGIGRRALPCEPAKLPGSIWSSGLLVLTQAQREGVVAWSLAHQDIRYSFLDYGALALHRLGVKDPALQRYIRSTGHMQCAYYTDTAYSVNDVHLFTDGRWEGYVAPWMLARALQNLIVTV